MPAQFTSARTPIHALNAQELMLVTAYEKGGLTRFISTENSIFTACPALSGYSKVNIIDQTDAPSVY